MQPRRSWTGRRRMARSCTRGCASCLRSRPRRRQPACTTTPATCAGVQPHVACRARSTAARGLTACIPNASCLPHVAAFIPTGWRPCLWMHSPSRASGVLHAGTRGTSKERRKQAWRLALSAALRRGFSLDKAALFLNGNPEEAALPAHAPLGRSVKVSADVFELLRLKDRAMDNTKEGITIADCSQPGMPLIYANESFARITGYSVAESLGKNCRFLQVARAGASCPLMAAACSRHACNCSAHLGEALFAWTGTSP